MSSTGPPSKPPRVLGHPRKGSAPLDTSCPSNYSSGCRKHRGRPCRKRGVPLSVAEKQQRQRCAHTTTAPPSSTAPAPEVLPVFGTLSSTGITLGAPRGSRPAYAWTSHSLHMALASSVLPALSPRALIEHSHYRMGCWSPSERQEGSRAGMQLPLKAVKDPSL